MIIEPKVKGFICITAHREGCFENVRRQIDYTKSLGLQEGPKKALVIGASTGYGLASRIMASFGCGAATIGVMYERESNGKRTATPGWYNTEAFEKYAKEEGIYAKSINGDAFSKSVKEQTIEMIKKDLSKIDLIIYSLAAPKRALEDGTVYQSVLKTTKETFTNKSWNLSNNTITEASITPATEEEINATVKVMGGEDWLDWIKALKEADVLSEHVKTVAYSYIGPELTYPVYKEGTIGMAKKHLKQTADDINRTFQNDGIQAYISVNKALVTQASSAIPIVPLYFAILYKVMKEHQVHEGCIEQMNRLFRERLYQNKIMTDAEGRIRMDDWEMREDIQKETMDIWERVNSDNLLEIADVSGYWEDFYHMFGFHFDSIDYTKDIEI